MIYDIFKILKKCLKLWYVFLATLILGVVVIVSVNAPLRTFKTSFDVEINCVNEDKVYEDKKSLETYYAINRNITELVVVNYVKDNYDIISEKFELNKPKFGFIINVINVKDNNIIRVNLSYPEQGKTLSVREYIKEDLLSYIDKISENNVPENYKTSNTYVIQNIQEEKISVSKIMVNYIFILMAVIILEIITIGIFTLINNTILFDDEIKEEFEKPLLIGNYKHNYKLFIETIKINFNKKRTIIIGENEKNFESVITSNIKFVNINNINSLKQLQAESIIIEVVKNKTKIKHVNKIMELIKCAKVEDVYFVTCKKGKKNESITNK